MDLVDICTIYTDGNTVCGLDRATASYRLVQSGDSGGPVVVNNGGSSASMAGIISGGTASGTTLYFTHINKIVNTKGVAVAHY
ncbi:trypsin-like serine protease [Pseudarthrobacter sp. NBSH8]|uniref:trypsin-like serine protease n=1 Tax=Pseudarthrobacter sp. NBSH8 TaxID=2596911 RepID=UPI0016294D3B|nr:trypsin-like serine protease [Pseudarthrobacter sp. NBSH8]